MVDKLFPYHNAPSSSGALVITNKPNKKENFHSGDIVIIHSSKNKIKKDTQGKLYMFEMSYCILI